MDTLNTICSSSDGRESEDALRVLGRVADAFDNPSLHKTDREVLFVVNVVKSRRLLTSVSSEESVCQDATYGSYDSSIDSSCDEEVELVELGDVSVWERANSYPYVSRRCQSHEFRQGDGMYDVTKMLLTSSPLDRLDRLARMELKKTGWFERTDKWAIVEMGLQESPLSTTPPKTLPKTAAFRVRESWERFSSPLLPTKTTSPSGEKQIPGRPETGGGQSPSRRVHTPDRSQRQGDGIKSSTPTSTESPVHSQDSDSYLVDFSTLSCADAARTTTPIRASRLSCTRLYPQTCRQPTRGRFGQVVRNFVKRMLPPSGVSRTRCTGIIKGTCGDSPAPSAGMTPRSDASGESEWTFASMEGWLDYQTTNRWSGFWN